MSGGGVAAIVIVSLLLVGGSVAGYFVYKKKDIIRWRQFSYARQGRGPHSVLPTYRVTHPSPRFLHFVDMYCWGSS